MVVVGHHGIDTVACGADFLCLLDLCLAAMIAGNNGALVSKPAAVRPNEKGGEPQPKNVLAEEKEPRRSNDDTTQDPQPRSNNRS